MWQFIINEFLSSFLTISDTLFCNIYVVLLKFILSLASLFPYMQYIMLNWIYLPLKR